MQSQRSRVLRVKNPEDGPWYCMVVNTVTSHGREERENLPQYNNNIDRPTIHPLLLAKFPLSGMWGDFVD